MAENGKSLAITEKNLVDAAENNINKLMKNGRLDVPPNYSVSNALRTAYLVLTETVDANKNPVLEVCTRESIVNSLLMMVTQGLNPAKKQGYFIAYGKTLTFQRSYFGAIHIAKQVDPRIEDVVGEVVYAKDTFEYEKKRGKTLVIRHVQKLENVNSNEIIAAYATILYYDGSEQSIVMTLQEVHQAWRQSKQAVFAGNGALNANTVHGKFTADMAKRTVINKACKFVINSSDDNNLMLANVNNADLAVAEAAAAAEIAENANTIQVDENGEVIDIPVEQERTTEEQPEQEPQAEQPPEPKQPAEKPKARSNRPAPTPPEPEGAHGDADF